MIRKNYIVLLVLSSFFCSCSKEAGEGIDPNAPVGLDARIAGVSLITRGGATEDAKNISSLGIYAVNKTSSENAYGQAPAGTYCAYKIEGGIASPNNVEGEPLWLCQEQAIIFSCHPAPTAPAVITPAGSPDAPNPTVTIPEDAITLAQTDIAAKDNNVYDFAEPKNDYMYGVAYDANKFLTTQPVADNGRKKSGNTVINTSGPSVAIGLKHAFAQIKLVISKGDSYQGDAKITEVKYTRNMKTLNSDGSTTMSLKDGALANTAAATSATYSFTFADQDVVTAAAAGSPVTLINYVLPNDAASSTFTVTVDDKPMTMEHSTDPKWDAGAIYTYTLTINGTGLALSGFTVVGWGDVSQPDIPNL